MVLISFFNQSCDNDIPLTTFVLDNAALKPYLKRMA